MALTANSIFEDKFLILEELGVGAFGDVYKAREIELHRIVAIKILREHCDTDSRNRFVREAQIMSVLRHPAVASLYHFGRTMQDGTECFYIVMEYVEGETLASRLSREERIDPLTAIGICARVCDGLEAAHQLQIVHRDLSPANIMLESEGTAKIIDFGLARLQNTNVQALTISMKLVGNPFYMSPEQCACEKLDGRSDIYSLGCVLYQMLSGRTVFDAEVGLGILFKHRHEAPPALHQFGIDPAIVKVVEKCLAKLPEDRYQSAKELAADLRLLAQSTGIFEIAKVTPVAKAASLTGLWKVIISVSAVLSITCGYLALSSRQKFLWPKDRSSEVPYLVDELSGRNLVKQGDRIHREQSLRKMSSISSTLSDLSPEQLRWCGDVLDGLLAEPNVSINQEEFRSLIRAAADFAKHEQPELRFKALKLAFFAGRRYVDLQPSRGNVLDLAALLDLSLTYDAGTDYSHFEELLVSSMARAGASKASDAFATTGHWLNYRLGTQRFQIVDHLVDWRFALARQVLNADANSIDAISKSLLDDMAAFNTSGAGSFARARRFIAGFDKLGAPRAMPSFKARLLYLAYAMSNEVASQKEVVQALEDYEAVASDSPNRFDVRFALVTALNYSDTPLFSRDLLLHALTKSPTKTEVKTIVELARYVCANLGFIGRDVEANSLLSEIQLHADRYEGLANLMAHAKFMNLVAQNRGLSALKLSQRQVNSLQAFDMENIKWTTALLSLATTIHSEPYASTVCTSLQNRLTNLPPTRPLHDDHIFLLNGACRALIFADFKSADRQLKLLDYRLNCRPALLETLLRKYPGALLTERLGSEGLLQDRTRERTMDLGPILEKISAWRSTEFTSGTALLVLHLLKSSDFTFVDRVLPVLEQRCSQWPGALREVRALQLCRELAPLTVLSLKQVDDLRAKIKPLNWLERPGVSAFCNAKLSDLCPSEADDTKRLELAYLSYRSLRNSPATYGSLDYARSKARLGKLLLQQRHFVEYTWLFEGDSWQRKPAEMNGVFQ